MELLAGFVLLILASFAMCMIFNQISLLELLCTKLHLPIEFRVHQWYGLDDENFIKKYPASPHNPWRLNVDINIDGMIVKYHGRY